MKKLFILILFLIFNCSVVYAESYSRDFEMVIKDLMTFTWDSSRIISDSYVYENGLYKLTGNIMEVYLTSYPYDQSNPMPVLYSCVGGNTECETMIAILPKLVFSTSNGRYYLTEILRNGELFDSDKLFVYYSDEYELLENGKYRLINPERNYGHNLPSLDGKYICDTLYEYECDNISYISENKRYRALLDKLSERVTFGTSYIYQDNSFVLQDTFVLNPFFGQDTVGTYTCFEKDNTCDKLYKITSVGEIRIYADMDVMNPVTVTYDILGNPIEENIMVEETEEETILNINNDDLITIEDEEIIDIEINDGTAIVKPKKEGKTDVIIISKDDEIRVIHIEVKGVKKTAVNPNTTDVVIIVSVLLIISLLLFGISEYKLNNN